MTEVLEALVERLVADRPRFHREGGREVSSFATPGTLRFLAGELRAGQTTLETGCGASTVLFAAAGTSHTA